MDDLKFKLEDIGTRYIHYVQLLDLWEFGLDIMKKYTYKSSLDEKRVADLEVGINLLRKQIEVMGDYDPYETFDIINSVPKNLEDIKD